MNRYSISEGDTPNIGTPSRIPEVVGQQRVVHCENRDEERSGDRDKSGAAECCAVYSDV